MTLFQADEPLLELEYTLVCEGGKPMKNLKNKNGLRLLSHFL